MAGQRSQGKDKRVGGKGASGIVSLPASGTATPTPPMAARPLRPTPPGDGPPITDVNTLPVVSAAVAAQIRAAAGLGAPALAVPEAALALAQQADKPGTERWPVKTGQDDDRAKVGKNIINGVDLKPGIVEATVEELTSLPRPPGLTVATQDPPQFQSVRDGVTEVTIWRIEAVIIALKHETDGDYHLVLQGTSGGTMVGEIPTPTTVFVGNSPWLMNIGQARQQIDQKLVANLSPVSFTLRNGKYVPHGASMFQPGQAARPELRFDTPVEGSGAVQPLFATRTTATPVRITGVGFFDRAHGATGAAPNVIELHPVLKVEFT